MKQYLKDITPTILKISKYIVVQNISFVFPQDVFQIEKYVQLATDMFQLKKVKMWVSSEQLIYIAIT